MQSKVECAVAMDASERQWAVEKKEADDRWERIAHFGQCG